MSIIANNLLQGDEGYNISRSLRLRESASAYLNRTPSVTSSQTTWTLSMWFKRGKLNYGGAAAVTSIFGFSHTVGGQSGGVIFSNSAVSGAGDNLAITAGANIFRVTNAVFRDPSAWYHLVAVWDTTNATDSLRARIYINGVLQTYATSASITQNSTLNLNAASVPVAIGADIPNGGSARDYFDGYLTEVNFIDGQALTPSSFGETDPLTGVWKAKKYAGTYGTNGFYLPFSDNTSTTTLGYDKSGNSNNWTTNNISLTAGTTYDSMVDVPTMSDLASNYCVLNPLRNNGAISRGNLLFNGFSGQANNCNGTFSVKSGKWYFEGIAGYLSVGIINISVGYINTNTGGSNYYLYNSDGSKNIAGSSSAYGASYTTNDTIGVALDCDGGSITFYKNGVSQGVATTGIGSIDLSPFIGVFQESDMSFNFGQQPWKYTPPTGFVALNTFNL